MKPLCRTIDIWQNGDAPIVWCFATRNTSTGVLTYVNLTGVTAKLQIRAFRDPSLPALMSFDSATLGGLSFVTEDPAGIGVPGFHNSVQWLFTRAAGFPTTALAPFRYTAELELDPFPTTGGPEPVILLDLPVHATGTR